MNSPSALDKSFRIKQQALLEGARGKHVYFSRFPAVSYKMHDCRPDLTSPFPLVRRRMCGLKTPAPAQAVMLSEKESSTCPVDMAL